MNAPQWADRLAARVCETAGAEPPAIDWRRSRQSHGSTGRYFPTERRLVVTAGTDRRDQRLVLLHELAHHLTPGEHHGPAFWRVAWSLYRAHRLARYALTRETGYRREAGQAAIAARIPGARAAARAGDAKRRRNTQPRGTCPMPADQASAQGYRTPHTHYAGTIHCHHNPDGTRTDYATPRSRAR